MGGATREMELEAWLKNRPTTLELARELLIKNIGGERNARIH